MGSSVALGGSNRGGWRLGGPSFDFVGGELFEVGDARLESFDALAFADVRARASVVVSGIYARVRSCSIRGAAPWVRSEVRVGAVALCARGEVGCLVVLAVVHLHCLTI